MSAQRNGGGAGQRFADLANGVARQAGRPSAFVLAIVSVIVWLVLGPYFAYSDTWQLVINTGTTIVTFLMVFLIQNSQNRDGAAIQVKLDELIRASNAQNFYIGLEHLTDEEIEAIRRKCEARAGARSSAVATATSPRPQLRMQTVRAPYSRGAGAKRKPRPIGASTPHGR